MSGLFSVITCFKEIARNNVTITIRLATNGLEILLINLIFSLVVPKNFTSKNGINTIKVDILSSIILFSVYISYFYK